MLVLDVLQLCLAEIDDARSLRQVVSEQGPRRLREQDLAAVSRGADPGRADDVETEVTLVADRGLSGVQAHPHLHRHSLGPRVRRQLALGADRRPHRIPCSGERVEECVALRIDLRPAVRSEGLADDLPVVSCHVRVCVTELLQEPRRSLDVGEDERDCSGGQDGHGRDRNRVRPVLRT